MFLPLYATVTLGGSISINLPYLLKINQEEKNGINASLSGDVGWLQPLGKWFNIHFDHKR